MNSRKEDTSQFRISRDFVDSFRGTQPPFGPRNFPGLFCPLFTLGFKDFKVLASLFTDELIVV